VRRLAGFALLLALTGCDSALPVQHFAGQGPELDPLRFFARHVRSWGVLEDRGGAPTGTVATDCAGQIEPDGSLAMHQHLTYGDGTTERRDWRMRRTGPGTYEATATGMVGTGNGEAAGRVFHLAWTLAARPGNPLANVAMDQWMYLQDDGAVVNRTVVRKLGVVVAEVTEQFAPAP
jgi:hypothetical protein